MALDRTWYNTLVDDDGSGKTKRYSFDDSTSSIPGDRQRAQELIDRMARRGVKLGG